MIALPKPHTQTHTHTHTQAHATHTWSHTPTSVVVFPGEAGVVGWEDLQFDQLRGGGQQLGGLQHRAVLCGRPVDGQQMVPHVERPAPGTQHTFIGPSYSTGL